MDEIWMLIALSMPLAADSGLVMGWRQTYATERECMVARVDAMQRAKKTYSLSHVMVATCARVGV